jgi:YHS domain-containing protein
MQETGEFDMAVCLSIYHASKRTLLAALLVAGLAAVGSGGDAMAESRINKSFFGATAIDGYDPVAYFTMTRAVRGVAEFSHIWLGATWQFANTKHREMFMVDPPKYVPQYGGYCAEALSNGSLFGTDPEA